MPLYEYACETCKVRTELIQSVDARHDAPLCKFCPEKMALVPSIPFRAIISKGCTGAQLH